MRATLLARAATRNARGRERPMSSESLAKERAGFPKFSAEAVSRCVARWGTQEMVRQPSPFGNAHEAEQRLRRLKNGLRAVTRRYERAVQRRRPEKLIPLIIIATIVGMTLGLALMMLFPSLR
jgi:hypothetical protein